MPASLNRVRKSMKVAPTARDKGLKLTLTVVAYDTGMVTVDGYPMTNPESGWVDAAEMLIVTLNEFRRQASRRPRSA
jgi:hypothetical protein